MLVRCFVESVRINLANNSRVVILKDSKIERYLLIWIGETESYAIASELQGAHYERPLTHDLLYTIVGRLGAEVTEIVINNLEGDVFYALITLQQGGTTLQVDARRERRRRDAVAAHGRRHPPHGPRVSSLFVRHERLSATDTRAPAQPVRRRAGHARERWHGWARRQAGHGFIPRTLGL